MCNTGSSPEADWVPGRAKSLIRFFFCTGQMRHSSPFPRIPQVNKNHHKGCSENTGASNPGVGLHMMVGRFSSFNCMNWKSLIRLQLDNMLDHAGHCWGGQSKRANSEGVHIRCICPVVGGCRRRCSASAVRPSHRVMIWFDDLSILRYKKGHKYSNNHSIF